MAYYIEEEAWKCPKHPSKKRRTTTGVCSICLIDRLSQLCPHCANLRPCSSNCSAAIGGGEAALFRSKSVGIPFLKSRNANSGDRKNQLEGDKIIGGDEPEFCRSKSVGIPFLKSQNVNSGDRREIDKSNKTTSSSSSSGKFIDEPVFSSSKSVGIPFLKSQNVNSGDRSNMPETDKSNRTMSSSACSGSKIIGGSEPAINRSKSVGIPFLKSRNVNSDGRRKSPENENSYKTASFWGIFKRGKWSDKYYCRDTRIMAMTVMRSRSVKVETTSVPGGNEVSCSPEKLKGGWYLVSPMKVFRQSPRAPKSVN